MYHYGDDGYPIPDSDELKLECEKCKCEFIDLKINHMDDEGDIITPIYCNECKENK